MASEQPRDSHPSQEEESQSSTVTSNHEAESQPGQPAVLLTIPGIGQVLLTLDQIAHILNKTPEEVEVLLSCEDSTIEADLQSSQEFNRLVQNGTFPTN